MTLRRIFATSLLLAAPAVSLAQTPTILQAEQVSLQGLEATVYKSPTCGCCEGYIAFLRAQGVTAEVISDDTSLYEAKEANGVPAQARSCHTVLLGGYVVEGHVPLAALEKLLSERPDVLGVAMPGMPTGTPGMEGPQFGPLEVVSFKDGSVSPFISL